MTLIFNKFMEHASKMILFLKSILQVSLLTWEEGSPQPGLDYSINIDPLSAVVRNPFSEKKWKKFQLSSIFGSSTAAIKLQVLDLNVDQGGTRFVDRWLVVLSMGSGQTKNMALDRRYLAYNLTPVAGVAAHISRNGHPAENHASNTIMSPLPLSCIMNIPVTVVGSFLVRHNRGRYLFRCQDNKGAMELRSDAGSQLIEAWNQELMSCVCDSYTKLILEMQKLRREPLTSALKLNLCRSVSAILSAYRDEIYSFWPRSGCNALVQQPIDDKDGKDSTSMKPLKANLECLIEQVIRPLYARLVELPIWQLYSGSLVKATDGMFLSQPGSGVGDNLLPATLFGSSGSNELPRDFSPDFGPLSKDEDSRSFALSAADSRRRGISSPASVSSGGDAIDMMTSFGKALFDFGRGVVEDISRVPENVKPSAGQPLYRFMLEISPGTTELVHSSNIFSFKNILYGNEDLVATTLEPENEDQSKGRLQIPSVQFL
ncbi:UNVERIFIED_CONTAM: hypothetical protein Slati_0940900 [Sesamum latifolium]|uniref:Uncharacterized protein n=1 Tax=Sesamum latifolium TaxID=2727402 RepID=A0AAW2XSV9_9LAMI